MPKEVIRSRPEVDDGAGPFVRLGWSKDSETVELGTVVPQGEGRVLVKNADPADPEVWGDVMDRGEGVGWFVQLNRSGINRLIRTLRTARDQAFGRDE